MQSVLFEVQADADCGVADRMLAPFARRGLTPDTVKMRRIGLAMEATVGLDALPPEMVHLVEGNLRQVVGVRRVEVVLRALVRQAA